MNREREREGRNRARALQKTFQLDWQIQIKHFKMFFFFTIIIVILVPLKFFAKKLKF